MLVVAVKTMFKNGTGIQVSSKRVKMAKMAPRWAKMAPRWAKRSHRRANAVFFLI